MLPRTFDVVPNAYVRIGRRWILWEMVKNRLDQITNHEAVT